jgi:hypothetical protein
MSLRPCCDGLDRFGAGPAGKDVLLSYLDKKVLVQRRATDEDLVVRRGHECLVSLPQQLTTWIGRGPNVDTLGT